MTLVCQEHGVRVEEQCGIRLQGDWSDHQEGWTSHEGLELQLRLWQSWNREALGPDRDLRKTY